MAPKSKSKSKLLEDEQITHNFDQIFKHPQKDDQLLMLHQTWFRNVLYYLGEQWLAWFNSQATFGRRFESNFDIPTPVANTIRDHVRSMIALTTNKRYVAKAWPNSEEWADRDAAALSEELLSDIEAKNAGGVEDTKEILEMWRHLTGNAFLRTFINDDCGRYIISETGEIQPQAEIQDEVIIPYNVVVPSLGTTLRDKLYVGIQSLQNKSDIEDKYGVELNQADNADEIDYQRTLMKLVANVSPWKGRVVENDLADEEEDEIVIFKEVEYRPTRKYPKGYYVAMAGGEVLVNQAKMPIPVDKKGYWFYSLTHFPYNRTPGTFWCSGSVDDLISPQNTINEVDQALTINRKSIGRPWILSPADLLLTRVSARGNHLLQVKYAATGAAAVQKPQIVPGQPYPQQVLEERTNQREVIQDAGGDPKNILRGHSPHSGASGVMVDILREAAESAHTPDVKRFYRAWTRSRTKYLVLAQTLYTNSQTLKVAGAGNLIRVRKFKGADLRGTNDIRMELDSGLSTTRSGQNELFMQMVQYNLFSDETVPPAIRRELLKRMGLSEFPEEQNLHRDRAEYENSMMMAGVSDGIALPPQPIMGEDGEPTGEMEYESYDPVFRLDDHAVHIEVLNQIIFSREFRTLKPESQFLLIMHRDMHEAALQEQLEAQKQEMMELANAGQEQPGAGEVPGGQSAGMPAEGIGLEGTEGGAGGFLE